MPGFYHNHLLEDSAMWTKPVAKDIRLGFEITMYCYSR